MSFSVYGALASALSIDISEELLQIDLDQLYGV
jgi:hypothetical protein